jgi:stearoyl-CoA desaturase (delta-9 desaturase)
MATAECKTTKTLKRSASGKAVLGTLDSQDKVMLAGEALAGEALAGEALAEESPAAKLPVGGEPRNGAADDPFRHGIDWPVVAWIVIVHAGALAAPFFFTWKALGVAAFLAWLTGSVGVCMGYHRQLTHGSFCTYRPIRWFFALMGGLSGEGSALMWVANHRKHHMFSDQDGDPHSPRDGKWWSHILWFMPALEEGGFDAMSARYAPDLAKDPGMRFLHYFFLPSHILLTLGLFLFGYLGWDFYTGCSFVAWGMFVRLIYVLHVTWLVNSASHIWGYRNYETSDDSRNLWWVGLLAFGEGWHNNHHAYQRMARQGHKWWEVDVTYWAICVLEKLGLAWNVVHEVPKGAKPA